MRRPSKLGRLVSSNSVSLSSAKRLIFSFPPLLFVSNGLGIFIGTVVSFVTDKVSKKNWMNYLSRRLLESLSLFFSPSYKFARRNGDVADISITSNL